MLRRSLPRLVAATIAARAVTGIGWAPSLETTAQWLRREDPAAATPPEPDVPSPDELASRPARPPGSPSKPSLRDESLVQWLETHAHMTLPEKQYLEKNVHFAQLALSDLPHYVKMTNYMFLQFVVPFQHLDEPVDDWRELFYRRLRPLVQDAKSLREIAEIVIPATYNGGLGRVVEFKSNSTPEVMAPVSETLAKGYASCTGMSILLANALRAVGVPARIVGTGRWKRPEGGNHNWVEFWTGEDGGGWHFTDAVPVDRAQIDSAWFVPEPTQHAVPYSQSGIYTHLWDAAQADSAYLITWRDPPISLPALDRTEAYLQLSRVNQNES